MPNPKRRHSKSRTRQRRAHDALRAPQTVPCENCQEPRAPHRVCEKCGANLNENQCSCEQGETDPRWAALADLKKEENGE